MHGESPRPFANASSDAGSVPLKSWKLTWWNICAYLFWRPLLDNSRLSSVRGYITSVSAAVMSSPVDPRKEAKRGVVENLGKVVAFTLSKERRRDS